MHKIMEEIKKELKQIEQTGLNAGNIDAVGKMVDILKDIHEIKELEGEGMKEYGNEYARGGRGNYRGYNEGGRGGYNEGGYNARGGRGGYNEGGYNESGYGREDYARNYGRGGNFINIDPRMMERIDRIMEGAEMYEYGRNRYRGGDSEERMHDGLEKMMYAICMFVESAMDFAETPQEKEIIRKHIQKIAKL